MRQIVKIQIGQCGNSIGTCYWKSLCKEAGLLENEFQIGQVQNEDSKHYLQLYFQERMSYYIARAVFIDTDPTILDKMRESDFKNIFNQESFVLEQFPSQGVYNTKTVDSKFTTQIEDAIQKQVEEADSLQGFEIFLGTAGGTGSGIGSFVFDKLNDNYKGKIKFSYPVFPTILTCRSPLDLYNTILLFSHFQEQVTFMFDNEAIEKTCFNTFYNQTPDFDSMNKIISNAILGATQSLRYPGKVNTSFQKMAFSLIPQPNMHFITITEAPLMTQCQNLDELCTQLFTDDQPFFSYYPSQGKYLSCQLLLKGNISLTELDSAIYRAQPRESFVKWIPDNIQKTLCSEQGELSAMLLSNQTAITFSFEKLLQEFQQLMKNQNYLHVYQNSGIEQQELTDNMDALQNLYDEYSAQN